MVYFFSFYLNIFSPPLPLLLSQETRLSLYKALIFFPESTVLYVTVVQVLIVPFFFAQN